MKLAARDIMGDIAHNSNLLVEVTGANKEKLMSTLLNMMQDIHDICVKHHIKYALMGGSALGAIRHHGFIPWDDDLDISMLREDFEKFKIVFEEEMGDKYVLDAPNHKNRDSKSTYGKVYKKGTKLWEVQDAIEDYPYPRGIFLDIFIYENVSNNTIIQKFDGIVATLMKSIATSMLYWKYNNPILTSYYCSSSKTRIYFYIRKFVGVIQYIIPHKTWVNWFDKFVSRHPNSEYITAPTGRKYYLGEIIPRSWWAPLQLVEFEGHQFYTINNVIDYLLQMYGKSYMQLPPENKRERHFCYKLDFGE